MSGEDYAKKAADTLQSIGIFFGPSKKELTLTAISLYDKSVNYYIVDKDYIKASEIYNIIAELYKELGLEYNTALYYTKSAIIIYNIDKNKALTLYNKTIHYFIENGKFIEAAENQQKIAEIEEEYWLTTDAIISYNKAVTYYEIG